MRRGKKEARGKRPVVIGQREEWETGVVGQREGCDGSPCLDQGDRCGGTDCVQDRTLLPSLLQWKETKIVAQN